MSTMPNESPREIPPLTPEEDAKLLQEALEERDREWWAEAEEGDDD